MTLRLLYILFNSPDFRLFSDKALPFHASAAEPAVASPSHQVGLSQEGLVVPTWRAAIAASGDAGEHTGRALRSLDLSCQWLYTYRWEAAQRARKKKKKKGCNTILYPFLRVHHEFCDRLASFLPGYTFAHTAWVHLPHTARSVLLPTCLIPGSRLC